MAPVIPRPEHIHAFADQQALAEWYEVNHDRKDEIWVKLHKKGSGLATVSVAEALDLALCWGWIDGIRKSFDDKSYLQRYTPRGRKSIWSQVNREHVARLTAVGLMRPSGQAQVDAAKADGRWDRAYAAGSKLATPPELLAAIAAEPRAQALYEQLTAQNRYALAFRVHNLKTKAGRKKRIAEFVEMLKRGETPYPNGRGKRT